MALSLFLPSFVHISAHPISEKCHRRDFCTREMPDARNMSVYVHDIRQMRNNRGLYNGSHLFLLLLAFLRLLLFLLLVFVFVVLVVVGSWALLTATLNQCDKSILIDSLQTKVLDLL